MSGPPPGYMPPPPPPPPPGGAFEPPKPTSGKAVAALICGIAGPLVAFACPPAGIAVLVGLVLGILALLETGKEGSRSGRGLAIAGTILSALSVVATIGVIVFFFGMIRMGEEQRQEDRQKQLAHDSELIVERLVQYCQANNDSLGPGGPILTGVQSKRLPANAGNSTEYSPGDRVEGALKLEHLVRDDEMQWWGARQDRWELTITSQTSATLRAKNWSGELIWEVEIRDASTGRSIQTVP